MNTMINGPVPPFTRYSSSQRAGIFLGAGVVVVALSLLLGWAGGWIFREVDRWIAVQALIDAPKEERSPEKQLEQVEAMLYRAPDDQRLLQMRVDLFVMLARQSKTPMVYYAEAYLAAQNAWSSACRLAGFAPDDPKVLTYIEPYIARIRYAGQLERMHRESEASEIFAQLLEVPHPDCPPSLLALMLNNRAWLLLTNPGDEYNPEPPLELAKRCMSADPDAVRNAAYLDTLAVAYWANRKFDLATVAITKALALAEPSDLPLLLKHHDDIVAGKPCPHPVEAY